MKLKAHVYRDICTAQWFIDIDHPTVHTTLTAVQPSWPEAMLTAYALLRDIDKTLVEQVHAERAARRDTDTHWANGLSRLFTPAAYELLSTHRRARSAV